MNEHGFKTEIALNLQGSWLVYYSPAVINLVIRQMTGDQPVFLQTIDGHCVIVNPKLIQVVEVHEL